MGRIASWVGAVIGPVVTIISLMFDAKDAVALGLPLRAWAIIGAAVFFISVIAVLVGFQRSLPMVDFNVDNPKEAKEAEKVNYARPEQLTGPYIADHHFRLTSLAEEAGNPIRDKTFERCHIYGPGVAFFKDSTVINPTIRVPHGILENGLLEVSAGKTIDFVYAFLNCTFKSCVFHRIGILGTPSTLQNIRKASVSPKL